MRMILRKTDFGPITDASGIRGFFGEGYQYHHFLRPFGLRFEGCTFVAKTTTLHPKEGNAHLKEDGMTPRMFGQDCVYIDSRKGIILNAVGLSGPGAKTLFEDGRWQKLTEPFFISFMSVTQTRDERIAELEAFVEMFREYLPNFKAPVGLQINFSCPNVGLHLEELAFEVRTGLEIASALEIPLMPKFSCLLPAKTAVSIAKDPNCDAICVSNTIPWRKLPDNIDWDGLFECSESPLAKYGGGGLSGKPLLPIVRDWIRKARNEGLNKPINAGGGILKPRDVNILFRAGASSVAIGSIAMLRGWRVNRTINHAYLVTGGE